MNEEYRDSHYTYNEVLTTCEKVSESIENHLSHGWELVSIRTTKPGPRDHFNRKVTFRIREKPCQRSWVNKPCSPWCNPRKCMEGETEPTPVGFHSLALHFDNAARLEQEMKCFNEALQAGYEFAGVIKEEDRLVLHMKIKASPSMSDFFTALERDTNWNLPSLTFIVQEPLAPYQYQRLIQQVEAHGYECITCNTSVGHYMFSKIKRNRKGTKSWIRKK